MPSSPLSVSSTDLSSSFHFSLFSVYLPHSISHLSYPLFLSPSLPSTITCITPFPPLLPPCSSPYLPHCLPLSLPSSLLFLPSLPSSLLLSLALSLPFLPLPKPQNESTLIDTLSCLDELDNYVAVAAVSETECLTGIKQADQALLRSARDGDLQCSILMRRAQLLKIVVCVYGKV